MENTLEMTYCKIKIDTSTSIFANKTTDFTYRDDYCNKKHSIDNLEAVIITPESGKTLSNTVSVKLHVEYLTSEDGSFLRVTEIRLPEELISSFAIFGQECVVDTLQVNEDLADTHERFMEWKKDQIEIQNGIEYDGSKLHPVLDLLVDEFGIDMVSITDRDKFVKSTSRNFAGQMRIKVGEKHVVEISYENASRPFSLMVNWNNKSSLKNIKSIPAKVRKMIKLESDKATREASNLTRKEDKLEADILALDEAKIPADEYTYSTNYGRNNYQTHNGWKVTQDKDSNNPPCAIAFTLNGDKVNLKKISGEITLEQLKAIDNIINNRIDTEL